MTWTVNATSNWSLETYRLYIGVFVLCCDDSRVSDRGRLESLADNSPTLLHGRLRRKEASFIMADARFTRLVEMVEVGPVTKYTNAVFQFFLFRANTVITSATHPRLELLNSEVEYISYPTCL